MNLMDNSTLLKGNIQKELIALAFPLLLSNILQQLYNTADSLIIAHFLGSQAFASTGVSGTLMNLFIFVLNGFCVGISVIFAQAYGKGDKKGFRQNFFLALIAGTGLTILFGALMILFLDPALRLIHTPFELTAYCRTYMTIILAGLSATWFYNFFASVLRSAGNTKASLYFLAFSVLANVVLDLLFVGVFHTGIAGAAYATVMAQTLSAIISFFYLQKKYPDLLFTRQDIAFQRPALFKIMRFGLVSAMHQSSLYIGKILVQGTVNTLGTAGIAAYTATMRIEGIANSFGDSGSQAISIFISQNYGAGSQERVSQGFQKGFSLLVLLGSVVSAVMFFTSSFCLRLFLAQSDHPSMDYGVSYLKTIALFYILCFIGNAFVGYFRGIGKVVIPFFGTTLHLTLRVILTWILIAGYELSAVAIATGSGWVLVVIYYLIVSIRSKRSADRRLSFVHN